MQQKNLERQLDQLKNKVAQSQLGNLEDQARTLKGVKVLAGRVDGLDREQMRALADSLRNKWRSAVVVLASADDSTVAIVSAVTKDLRMFTPANWQAPAQAMVERRGRPDMAEAGEGRVGSPAHSDRIYGQPRRDVSWSSP
jgi:alanyl-tRNA synthetase